MSDKIFYRKRLAVEEEGLTVRTEEWISIHETRCFHFCVPKNSFHLITRLNRRGESALSYARRIKQLKRIDKRCSRFAFETQEQALDHLRMLKRRQLQHMERDRACIEAFLGADNFETSRLGDALVPGSSDLVHEHYRFD